MADRHPYDSKPYYCKKCGMGFAEYIACELPDCELETEGDATLRAAKHEADFLIEDARRY